MNKAIKNSFLFLYSLFLVWTNILFTNTLNNELQLFSLQTTSTWLEFNTIKENPTKKEVCPTKSVLVGSITMKSKEALHINNLILHWNGSILENISASLYSKNKFFKKIVPIQENLICDGTWNNKKQEFLFHLDEKIVAVNTYHLVLSFPTSIEKKLIEGNFSLSNGANKTIVSLSKNNFLKK